MIINNPLPDLPVTSPNTINIVRTSDFVQHVRPPPPGVQLDQYTAVGSTRNDTVLSGLVIVHLAKPKRARYLLVEHITTARLPASARLLEDSSLWTYKGWGSREVNRTAPKSRSECYPPASLLSLANSSDGCCDRFSLAGCHPASKRHGTIRDRPRYPSRSRTSNASPPTHRSTSNTRQQLTPPCFS